VLAASCGGGATTAGTGHDANSSNQSGGESGDEVHVAPAAPDAGPPSGLSIDTNDPAVQRARTLFAEGLAAYEAGRLEEAATKLAEAYGLVPTPELAFNVARIYERMGDAEKGIAHFRIYLRDGTPSDPERADITRRIAALEALAQRQHDQIFAAPPSTDDLTAEARTFFLRGVTMFQGRHFDAAMQAFIAAYNFARLPEVIYNLAITAEKLERTQDAIDYYREFLRARPEDPNRTQIEAKVRALRGNR
jgi:tetratricopeptide (TPR) repeat protein